MFFFFFFGALLEAHFVFVKLSSGENKGTYHFQANLPWEVAIFVGLLMNFVRPH